jgi:transposase
MFIVELQTNAVYVAPSPENAVQQFKKLIKNLDEELSHYDVWDTDSNELYVIAHDPLETQKPYERTIHLSLEKRERLVEEMMHKAQCDDSVLRQICEIAATRINDQEAYEDWVGYDEDDVDDVED